MEYMIGIICFIIFLYFLYVLGKDDYVLIRKNLPLDQLFDYTFAGVFIGFILARIISVIFHPLAGGGNFISQFFSYSGTGITLTGFVLGCIIALFLTGKYRKLPLGRLFDILTLAFLSSLTAGYLLNVFLVSRREIVYYLILGIIYLIVLVVFWRYLFPIVIRNKIKEGSSSCIFFMIFSVVTLSVSIFHKIGISSFRLEVEDVFLAGIFLVSLLILLRNERKKIAGHKL